MNTTPHDMIMKAHVLMGQEVKLVITDEARDLVYTRYGKMAGIVEFGDPCVKIEGYRDEVGPITDWTLVAGHEIVSIDPA